MKNDVAGVEQPRAETLDKFVMFRTDGLVRLYDVQPGFPGLVEALRKTFEVILIGNLAVVLLKSLVNIFKSDEDYSVLVDRISHKARHASSKPTIIPVGQKHMHHLSERVRAGPGKSSH